MALNMIERQRLKDMVLKHVEQRPGCRIQEMVAGIKEAYIEIERVVEDLVDAGRLDRWCSSGTAHYYIPGTYTPMPIMKAREKTGDRYIEAYLDAFDEFCDECMERYDAEVIGNLSTEAMISLYRGFIAALPAIKKAGGEK